MPSCTKEDNLRGGFLLIILTILLSAEVYFYSDFDKTAKLAQEQNKLIYVFLHEDGCPWCRRMERRVLKSSAIEKILNKGYLSVKIEKDENIPNSIDTHFYPSSLIIDPSDNNHILMKLIGFTGAKPLLARLKETHEFYE